MVHYDAPPPTGGDYGTIFMADNMNVTVVRAPFIANIVANASNVVLSGTNGVAGGTFLFSAPAMLRCRVRNGRH